MKILMGSNTEEQMQPRILGMCGGFKDRRDYEILHDHPRIRGSPEDFRRVTTPKSSASSVPLCFKGFRRPATISELFASKSVD
jgi:hypothetical protein